MDRIELKSRVLSIIKEYKYAAIILAAGLVLMTLPSKKPASAPSTQQEKEVVTTQPLQDSLSTILSSMDGAGKVKVLLTQSQGERTIYQTDVQEGEKDIKESTVIISGTGKEQMGLVQQTLAPKYLGAVVLCQGADNASVRLAIVEAVSSATGLSTDKITVLKMK